MSIPLVIKAPLAVQLNRIVFAVYTLFFAWPIWKFRHIIVVSGLEIFTAFIFCSLLGLGYTFIRIPRSRWILAILGLLIPAVFWTGMCLMVFSRPEWWEWPFDIMMMLTVWFGYPIMFAVSLFWDKKTSQYFMAKHINRFPKIRVIRGSNILIRFPN